VFVHGGQRHDDTWQRARAGARRLGVPAQIAHDGERFHHRHDQERFHTLVRCRNKMLALARTTEDADVFVSLDTDVMLDDRRTLERLAELLADGWDTASPITWLHPAAARARGRTTPGGGRRAAARHHRAPTRTARLVSPPADAS
jgi:hypothetical protein